MKIKTELIGSVLLLCTTWACFEEDKPVPPYPGEVTTIPDSVQVYQSYFDFETNRIVRSYPCSSWQLGFECGTDGWHIITNSGASWFLFNTGQTIPDAVVDMPPTVNHLYDVQHEFPDSTAAGNWVITGESGNEYTGEVYLLGKYHNGSFHHIKQLMFKEVNDTSYRFFYKEQDNGFADTVVIRKSDSVNFVFYSFNEVRQVNLEPDRSTYDLIFGSYYDLATNFGVTIPYPVGGALLNTWQTKAALDSITPYPDILVTNLAGYNLTSQRDIPGYRWKTVTVDVTGGGSATYAVKTNYTYIIHTAQDNYYKLRFLSYTVDGKSGFPRFEFRKLE
jgi:hypothetical protein